MKTLPALALAALLMACGANRYVKRGDAFAAQEAWAEAYFAYRDASLRKLAKKIAAVRPPTVQKGPIAFAIIGSIAGGEASKAGAGKNKPPMPKEWLRAAEKMSGKGVLPDDTLAILWPDRKPGAPPAAK